ncbi:MAG: radical SAM protein [Candidatus Obscuribacterales bacterium]|nr:radical SAM protein [Candidatus Obscuribacterales bacterium]
MSLQVREIIAKSILTAQNNGSLSAAFDYSINPYAGCAFSCSYCYVPKFPNKDHEPSEWGSWVNIKLNAPELIRKERLKVFGSRIFFSSATDPYQYLELKYRLSRRCLEELKRYQPAKLILHTRSHLILQDIDLLQSFGKSLRVGVSITTDNESVRAEFEPKAPSIKRRLELIEKLHKKGIKVHASLAPLLPCDPERLVTLLTPYVDRIWIDQMHWKEVNNRPQLLEKYQDFFHPAKYAKTVTETQKLFYNKRLA